MGNKSVKDISRKDFASINPWIIDEDTCIGRERMPIVCFVTRANMLHFLEVFVHRKFNFNVVDHAGNTPLHYAAEKKTPELVYRMLEMGLSPTQTNKRKQSPLLVAVFMKRYHNIKPLAEAMYFADDKGNGPIHYAIRASDESMVRLLMANTPELSWWHVAQGHTDPREYHLNYFCDAGAFSPLGLAVILLKYDMVVCLIDMGADKSIECNGKTPKSILAQIGTNLLYGGVFPTKRCTREEVLRMWSILTKDIDVYRNIDAGATGFTGLVTGVHKYLS